MKLCGKCFIQAWFLLAILLLDLGIGEWVSCSMAEDTGDFLQAGRRLYEQHCARCHGLDGKGGGPDAKRLYPKPRDLVKGPYKFRSTESGTPPTDEDLSQTIHRGLPASGMPAFEEFTPEELRQLIAYVKSFSPAFTKQIPKPVVLTSDPGPSGADLMKGKQLYQDLGCASCHGNLGRGSGPSAKTLVDAKGNPIRAVNLTQPWAYRGGSDPRSMTLRILTGIDGTPMPSYAEAVPTEDFWHLSYYIHSLQEEPRWSMVVHAKASTNALPASLTDPEWDTVEKTTVSLGSNVYKDGAFIPTMVSAVSIQAIHDDQTIVLRLSWDDPTEDRGEIPDALGLVLKPFGVGSEVGTLRTWPHQNSPKLDVIYWSADRNLTQEGLSLGFSPVVLGATSIEKLKSEAMYEEGRWTLLIQRPLVHKNTLDSVPLVQEQKVPLAIAIWDGGNRETKKTRSSSMWLDLLLR